jgi:3-hydroxyisobutyrate dehydrogenase
MTTVAMLGTGLMGTAMARRLAASGFDVRAWNRTRAKAEPLAEAGVTVCDTPREACESAGVVITMLLSPDAVADTMTGDDGGFAGMSAENLWLQMSTVGVEGERRLRKLASEGGVRYLDAPVLGTVTPAEKGQLVILASGEESLRDAAKDVFAALGQRTLWVGDAGNSSRLKLVCNSWVLAVTTAVADAMALADGLGIDPSLFLTAIEGGTLDLPYAHLKGELIQKRDFPPAFPLAGAAKDAGLINDAAAEAGVHLAVAPGVRQAMEAARDAGHGEEDMAAVVYAIAGE